MEKKKLPKSFSAQQIARLGSLPFFSAIGEAGLEEMARVLAEQCKTEGHAKRVITAAVQRKFGDDGRCPSVHELWALCREIPESQEAEDAIVAADTIPPTCPSCAKNDWTTTIRTIHGVEYTGAQRCNCERGAYLKSRDAVREPGWKPDRSGFEPAARIAEKAGAAK